MSRFTMMDDSERPAGPPKYRDKRTERFAAGERVREFQARDPIHAGKFLADELEVLNMTPTELANSLHVRPNRIYQILSGKRALTADTALRLSQWFGTSPELWLNLQKLYELRPAEQQTGEEIKRTVAQR